MIIWPLARTPYARTDTHLVDDKHDVQFPIALQLTATVDFKPISKHVVRSVVVVCKDAACVIDSSSPQTRRHTLDATTKKANCVLSVRCTDIHELRSALPDRLTHSSVAVHLKTGHEHRNVTQRALNLEWNRTSLVSRCLAPEQCGLVTVAVALRRRRIIEFHVKRRN